MQRLYRQTFIAFLMLFSVTSWAVSIAECDIVNGIYRNSTNSLTELKFETLVDIFTLNNANTLTMKIDGKERRYIRSNIDSGRQTKMTYLEKKNNSLRAVYVMIDRSPRFVAKDREFYGNMIISSEIKNTQEVLLGINNPKNLVYNFYCRF